MTALASASAPPSTTLSGRALWGARALWLVLTLLALAVLAAGVAGMLPWSFGLEAPQLQNVLQWVSSPYGQWWLLIALDVLMALTFVGVGVILLWRRSSDWFVLAVSAALVLYGTTSTLSVNRLWPGDTPLAKGVLWLQLASTASVPILAYLFPDGRFVPRWTRWLAVLWCAWGIGSLVLPSLNPYLWPSIWLVAFFVLGLATGLAAQVYRYRRVATPAQRQQTKWVILGFALGTLVWGALSAFQVLTWREGQVTLSQALVSHASLVLGQALVPVCIGLSVLRYRLWDIDLVINRTIVYTIVVAILGGVFYLTGKVAGDIVEAAVGQSRFLTPLLSTMISAALFTPLKQRTQSLVDRRFYREKVDLQLAFAEFAHDLRGAGDETSLLQMLVARASELLHVEHAAAYGVGVNGELEPRASQGLPASLAGGWSPDPQTWASLQRGQTAVPQDGLGFQLAVPLSLPAAVRHADPLGVLALGRRLSGVGFSREDRALLLTLADQAATSIYIARSSQHPGGREAPSANQLAA